MESALESIRQKTLNSYRLMAYFSFAAAFIFLAFGIYEIIRALSTGRWAMAVFLPGIAIVFSGAGIGSLRLVRNKS